MTDELFHSTPWQQLLSVTYGFTRGEAHGIPFCVLDDPAGRRISALPFSDYLPVDDPDQAAQFFTTVRQQFPDHAITLKTRLAEALPDLTVAKRAVYHRYLPGATASSSFRRGSKQAMRAGTQVKRTTEAAAADRFQQLYHRQRLRKFGGIPQPPSFFAALQRLFMDTGRGFYLEAWTVAGAHAATLVVLRCGNGWFYKFGTSDPAHLADRPNNLLFTYLTEAVDAGEADFLDLGLSGSGEAYAGLRRFKSATGAGERPLTYLRYTPPDYDNRSGHTFLDAIRGVTDALVEQDADRTTVAPLSESLYRFFA